MKAICLPLLLCLLTWSCTDNKQFPAEDSAHLGEIEINASCNEVALHAYREGMLLLHSFEYVDAAEKFQEAQKLDSACAMAYWGEAMTHNHPLWRQQDTEKALEILSQLAPTKDARKSVLQTPFERDLFQAAEILFDSDSDKKVRDQNYADYLAQLHERYPENHEVGSLYALSLLGAVKGGRDYDQYAKGARIAESIIAENPNHPGALHYLIHSYDDPKNASKALQAANSYSKVAPDASHALHMPSHIYVAMGMWDEVVSSNIDSWEASVRRVERKELNNDELGYHSLLWLCYGHLQRKETDQARNCLLKMERYCEELPSERARYHLLAMKGAYFSQTADWQDDLLTDTFDYGALSIDTWAISQYLEAQIALADQDAGKVEQILSELKSQRREAAKQAESASATMCGGRYNRKRATPAAVDRAKVIELEIRALLADHQDKPEQAESYFRDAVALEREITFQFGPPAIVKPSDELFGEWLLEQGRGNEALQQFEEVLKRAPNRSLAVAGIKSSRES